MNMAGKLKEATEATGISSKIAAGLSEITEKCGDIKLTVAGIENDVTAWVTKVDDLERGNRKAREFLNDLSNRITRILQSNDNDLRRDIEGLASDIAGVQEKLELNGEEMTPEYKLILTVGSRELGSIVLNEEDAEVVARSLGMIFGVGEFKTLTAAGANFEIAQVA